MKFTREELEQSEFVAAKVWRAFRARGGQGTLKQVGLETNSQKSAVGRLIKRGWLRALGRDGNEMLYEALQSQHFLRIATGCTHAKAKRRLTKASMKADQARRTGLRRPMAQALSELRKELGEIRDSM